MGLNQLIKTGIKAPHILVIEDDDASRLSICRFLKQNAYAFTVAESGKHAIEQLNPLNPSPDIILINADMTQMNGFDTALAIHNQEDLKHIPILMIISSNNVFHIDKALAVGASEYISKPINWKILNNRLSFLNQSIQHNQFAKLATVALKNTHQGITITDSNQTILGLNNAFSNITGYSENEVLGETPRVLQSGKNSTNFYQRMWRDINTHGKWEGKIWNKRKNGEIFPEWLNVSAVKNEFGLITHYIGAFSDISTLIEREQQLHQLAHYDNLTGLPNRLLFDERLEQAIIQAKRTRKKVALLYIDLDNFKPINDTYGHGTGDIVLKITAQRLEKTIRDVDTACRLGGDEFAVILHDINAIDDAEKVAHKIIRNVSKNILVNQNILELGCSIGISVYPTHCEQPSTMIQQADAAMYNAKQNGKNQLTIYSTSNNAPQETNLHTRKKRTSLFGT